MVFLLTTIDQQHISIDHYYHHADGLY